jgi:hypothetical protein
MKSVIFSISSAVMVLYTLYRAFTTLVFLPFAGSLRSSTGAYYLALVFLAVGATALSFTTQKGLAASMASSVGPIAVIYWWVFICRTSAPIWSDFYWLVVPELCFALAGICKWAVSRPRSLPLEAEQG